MKNLKGSDKARVIDVYAFAPKEFPPTISYSGSKLLVIAWSGGKDHNGSIELVINCDEGNTAWKDPIISFSGEYRFSRTAKISIKHSSGCASEIPGGQSVIHFSY